MGKVPKHHVLPMPFTAGQKLKESMTLLNNFPNPTSNGFWSKKIEFYPIKIS